MCLIYSHHSTVTLRCEHGDRKIKKNFHSKATFTKKKRERERNTYWLHPLPQHLMYCFLQSHLSVSALTSAEQPQELTHMNILGVREAEGERRETREGKTHSMILDTVTAAQWRMNSSPLPVAETAQVALFAYVPARIVRQ
jgi:hypothetical protein